MQELEYAGIIHSEGKETVILKSLTKETVKVKSLSKMYKLLSHSVISGKKKKT